MKGHLASGALFRVRLLQRSQRSLSAAQILPDDDLPANAFGFLITPSAVLALLLGVSTATAANWPVGESDNPDCADPLAVETATIQRITDGDTVVLTDNRRVRLIGINTPELNDADEQLRKAALAAQNTLQSLLPDNEPVLLYTGTESHDRHNRLLAHVVRKADQLAVAAVLLKQGHAMHIAVAPNNLCATHFARLETIARTQQLGLWKIGEDVHSTKAASISKKSRGFKLITGTVTQVQTGTKHTQLLIDDNFALKVRKKLANKLNSDGALLALIGKQVEIRGWLSGRKNKKSLWLQHPANLRQLVE